MLLLRRHGANVVFPLGLLLLNCRALLDATASAVVANARHVNVVHDSCVVHITDLCDIYVVNATVVIKAVMIPSSTIVSTTGISIPVVNPSVKTNPWTPVAFMKHESQPIPSPPRRRP